MRWNSSGEYPKADNDRGLLRLLSYLRNPFAEPGNVHIVGERRSALTFLPLSFSKVALVTDNLSLRLASSRMINSDRRGAFLSCS